MHETVSISNIELSKEYCKCHERPEVVVRSGFLLSRGFHTISFLLEGVTNLLPNISLYRLATSS